jgi:hypothetical protein
MDDPIVKGVSMTSEEDVQFMTMAIEAAREGRRTPGGECVGAALVREGQAACITFNEGEMQHDPTAYAEIVAIRRLCAKLNTTALKGYDQDERTVPNGVLATRSRKWSSMTVPFFRKSSQRNSSWSGVSTLHTKAEYICADLSVHSRFSLAVRRRTIHFGKECASTAEATEIVFLATASSFTR